MKRKTVLVLLLAALLISTVGVFAGCTDPESGEPMIVDGKTFVYDSVEIDLANGGKEYLEQRGMTVEEWKEEMDEYHNGHELYFAKGRTYLDDKLGVEYTQEGGDIIADGEVFATVKGNKLFVHYEFFFDIIYVLETSATDSDLEGNEPMTVDGKTFLYDYVEIVDISDEGKEFLDRFDMTVEDLKANLAHDGYPVSFFDGKIMLDDVTPPFEYTQDGGDIIVYGEVFATVKGNKLVVENDSGGITYRIIYFYK